MLETEKNEELLNYLLSISRKKNRDLQLATHYLEKVATMEQRGISNFAAFVATTLAIEVLHDYKLAKKFAKKELDLGTGQSSAYYGLLLRSQRQFDKATKYFNKALAGGTTKQKCFIADEITARDSYGDSDSEPEEYLYYLLKAFELENYVDTAYLNVMANQFGKDVKWRSLPENTALSEIWSNLYEKARQDKPENFDIEEYTQIKNKSLTFIKQYKEENPDEYKAPYLKLGKEKNRNLNAKINGKVPLRRNRI